MEFHYSTNDLVREGDIVHTGNREAGVLLNGVVVQVIQPGSDDSVAYQCPQGGVLVEETWLGGPGLLLLTPPDGMEWEDLELIKRVSAES